MEVIVGIIVLGVILYIIFVKRTKKLYEAINKLNQGDAKSIILSQTLEQTLNIIKAQSKNIKILNDERTFIYKNNKYKIISYDNKVSLSIIEKNPNNAAKVKKMHITEYLNSVSRNT